MTVPGRDNHLISLRLPEHALPSVPRCNLSAASFEPSGPATIINNTFKIINTSSTIHQQPFKNHETSSTFKHHPPSKIINTSSTSNVHSTTYHILHQDTSAVPFVVLRRNASPSCGAQNGPRITELAVEAIVATTDSCEGHRMAMGHGSIWVNLGNMMMDDGWMTFMDHLDIKLHLYNIIGQ